MKPVSPWETVMWIAAAATAVGAAITAVVQDDRTGTWVCLIATAVILIAAGGERRRVLRRRARG